MMTARRLEYAVPCPSVLPRGSSPTPLTGRPDLQRLPYADDYLRPGFGAYRRWTFLTVEFPSTVRESHLAVSAAPRPVDALHFVSLAPSSLHRVKRMTTLHFRGEQAEVVRVVVSDGSIFQDHTVLLWTEGGHTYGVGFHGLDAAAAKLNRVIADSLSLVPP